MKPLEFDEIDIDMRVIDTHGNSGYITRIVNEHEVHVSSFGCGIIYCTDKDCPEYDPLFFAEE